MSVIAAEPSLAEARPIFRLGVETYHQMIHTGLFDEDDRVELIEGELHAMTPIHPDHAGKNNRLNRLLNKRVGDAALVSVQNPLTLAPRSEPEPDLMLLRPRDDFYEDANPTPADTLLVIEICDSSLRYDREVKVPLYAAHDIPEVWLVDLQHRRLEVYREPYREPGNEGYRLMLRPAPSEEIAPVLLPSVRLRVSEIW
jgi:Uma2 family endonuclease